MALYALLILVGVGSLLGYLKWRHGVYMMIVIAAVQDPLRKLVPGAPGYLVLATAPVLVMLLFSMLSRRSTSWEAFVRGSSGVGKAMSMFAFTCAPAAALSATYGSGSWMFTVLGIFSYSILLLSVALGFHFGRSITDLRKLLAAYCLISLLPLSGGVIEYQGLWPNSVVIGTEALDFKWIRYRDGYIVDLIAGFYRSPDVMGWHAAATVMFSVLLGLTRKGLKGWPWYLVAAAALLVLVLCGRRKMVYMVPLFFVFLAIIYWAAVRQGRWIGRLLLGFVPILIVGSMGGGLGPEAEQVKYYTEGSSETLDSIEAHGWDSVVETYRQSGFFGSGLGFASPGSQHVPGERPRVWQESGPSRVMMELGVPGLAGLIFLVFILFREGWRAVRRQLRSRSPVAPYVAGFLAFFLVNIGSLVVSGQILADSFIASMIGLSIGVALSGDRIVNSGAVAPKSVTPRVIRAADGKHS